MDRLGRRRWLRRRLRTLWLGLGRGHGGGGVLGVLILGLPGRLGNRFGGRLLHDFKNEISQTIAVDCVGVLSVRRVRISQQM